MLDLGMPAEDVKEENESDESDSESGSGSPPKNGGKKGIKEKALADEIDGLKEELSDAKQQIARLMEIQEAIARQTLSRSTIRSLFDSWNVDRFHFSVLQDQSEHTVYHSS